LITEEDLESLVGTQFPGGTYTPEPYLNWLTCDCVLAPELAKAGSAHPLIIYMATQAGLGLSLEELFELFKGSSTDGPMLGEWGMDMHSPMQVGTSYAVSGEITGVSRKTGKKTGVFDIIQFELQLRATSHPHNLVAVTRSSFIFPRRA